MAGLVTEQELGQSLSAPEGQILERKRDHIHPRDLATTLVAWSGRKLTPVAPVARMRGQRTVAELLLEDRE